MYLKGLSLHNSRITRLYLIIIVKLCAIEAPVINYSPGPEHNFSSSRKGTWVASMCVNPVMIIHFKWWQEEEMNCRIQYSSRTLFNYILLVEAKCLFQFWQILSSHLIPFVPEGGRRRRRASLGMEVIKLSILSDLTDCAKSADFDSFPRLFFGPDEANSVSVSAVLANTETFLVKSFGFSLACFVIG